MTTDHLKPTVEDERREITEDLAAESGADWQTQNVPGTFGCHELLDRLGLVAKLLEEAVVEHPACIQNAEWYAKARLASEALNDLYQNVGSEHL